MMSNTVSETVVRGMKYDLHISQPTLYVDNESRDRSGHVGHALVQTKSGKILDFNSNVSAYRNFGHGAFGYVEYRISEDGGETFGEIRVLPYSYETLMNGLNTVSVEKAVCAADGTVIAFGLMNSQSQPVCCEPWDIPVLMRSFDEGETWEEPKKLCDQRGRVYAALEKDGAIYVLMHCNSGEKHFCEPGHPYHIYRSIDNGMTFEKWSEVGFPAEESLGYGAMIFTPENRLQVYAYNLKDECHLQYAVSDDFGKTWYKTGKSYVANQIRNPQINFLDGQYLLHGRRTADIGFVLYTSLDGIHWDEGTILNDTNVSCYYSNNLVLENPKRLSKKRMLVQFSESYVHKSRTEKDWNPTVNVMHLWIESIC